MTIPLSLATEIRRLYFAEHWPVGTIAVQLHVHHETVRRALGLLPVGAPGRRTERPSLLDPYRGFIASQLALYPRLRATRIYDMIAERGYTGSMRTVRRRNSPDKSNFGCPVGRVGVESNEVDPGRRLAPHVIGAEPVEFVGAARQFTIHEFPNEPST